MKNEIPYQNFGSFVVRTPLFPINFLEATVLKENTTEEDLEKIYQLPAVQEAILLASPNLFSKLQIWLKGEMKDKKEILRLHYALMRYIIRMSARCTPFGLFAGFSYGTWGDETKIEFPSQEEYGRHTRLDMNYLCALAQDLAKQPQIREKIKFYLNSSIYPCGNQVRYVEYRYKKANRTHHIVAVDDTDYLQKVFEKASDGAYLEDLAKVLVDDEICIEEAREFIQELTDSQLLINELEPAITGPEFLDQILAVLNTLPGLEPIKEALTKTKNALHTIDHSTIGTTISHYQPITDSLTPLVTDFELKYLFQTDMKKPAIQCSLCHSIKDEVLMGFTALNKITTKPSETNLSQFKNAFYERYEDREVPLLQALDTEAGVGYRQTSQSGDVTPLVDDLVLPGTGDSLDIKWNAVHSLMFRKYRESITQNKYEIELTDKDLEPFEVEWSDLPDTLSSMIQIAHGKIFLKSVGGASAANLLGRFAHADEKTNEFVKEITSTEERLNPEAIYAEIIHLPESRIGNILLRPILRDYEIPYLAKSAVPKELQIPLQDLYISVRGNYIMLRSKKLNKEIRPRLSSAHNYSFNALPIYQFLCDLQTQNKRGGIMFNWGPLSGEYDFYPRVNYKNLIFSLARWNIKKEDIQHLLKIKEDKQLPEAVTEWRKSRQIPAWVALSDGDNELFINLENILCIKILLNEVKDRPNFNLVEFFYNHEDAIARSIEGRYTNEFILSFHRKEIQKKEL